MNRNDIDFTPFPNCGNNPFYMNEFNIANMLPTVPVTGPAITKALDTNDIDAINEILMNNSIISEKSSHDDKHPLYLWHGSSGNYPVVTGHVSTHGKKWVYATPDYNFALCYAGDKWNDFEINQSYYNGKLYLTEIEPDIFKRKFNRVGFMYRLPPKDFSPIKKDAVKQWKEWECPHDVIPEKVIQIDNILDELKKSGVILYEYPNLPPFIHNRNEYIKNKTFELLKMTNNEGIKDYVHKKFPDVVLEKKVERKNDKGEDVPEKCPKCGSPVKLVLRGEPVWVCSNKDCNEYFGTLPFNENVNESVAYRVTSDGVGIYQALRHKVDNETWRKLLQDESFTWLPKPDVYTNNTDYLTSYFTPAGYQAFTTMALPVIKRYIHDINVSKLDIPSKDIVYQDKYQFVINGINFMNESTMMKSNIDKDFKSKGKKLLSDFKEVRLTEPLRRKYLQTHKMLKHEYADGEKAKGGTISSIAWLDEDNLVAYVSILNHESGVYIEALEVSNEYRGYGLGSQLLKYAVNKFNATKLGVAYDNKIAINMYMNNGFKIDPESAKNVKDGKSNNYIMIKESTKENITESVLKSDSDIYWNKDKFDSGEINLCFITGLSGSGKSSMAHSQESDKIEVYELDDLVYAKDHFTMDNLKEYGDLVYTFFKKHPEYYLTQKECEDQDIPTEKYEDKIFPDFISHAMQYAKSHKNKKFILEGIWLYVYSKPEQLKDYAVYIKGTSVLKSKIRASKRDSKNEANNKLDRARRFISQSTSHWKHFIKSDNTLDTWRNYFIKQMESMNESVDSHTDKFLLQYMAETAKRSELPDSVFGIPEERKYPMPDKKHVISAIKLFGHVDKKYEEELAKRIIKNIRKYDIDVSFVTKNNKLYKYLLDSNLVKESVSLYDQFFLSPC